MATFKDLNLIPPILRALEEKNYVNPTFIQQAGIPHLLSKKDVLGHARTGTGKTAAFSIPILQLLHNENERSGKSKKVKALIITPTRELAAQIGDSVSDYGKYTSCRHAIIYGGVSQTHQVNALQKGVDILIATPGRLKDLINQGHVHLDELEIFVLDEADKMLDMGFINDIKFILARTPQKKQSAFFTATLTDSIKKLAGSILRNPAIVKANEVDVCAKKIEQSVYFVSKQNKKKLLFHLLENESISNVLVFTKTKHGADRLAKDLSKSGIQSDALHGGKSQNARDRALANFKSKKSSVLVVTDVAARGIDIEKLAYVINYDLPNEAETYVHRIGRTGRAGESGHAISFCDDEELNGFKKINNLANNAIREIANHPFLTSPEDVGTPVKAAPEPISKRKASEWSRGQRISAIYNSFKKRLI